ncbi:MAG: chromosome partitioning protein ParB [Rhodobacteraceae bacterium]|nr:MAG: chromosome partitioning protein ParB [Paracoccaceae bacterium]
MLEKTSIPLALVHVPVKRRQSFDAAKAAALAESILEEGMRVPIRVRPDGDRFVLVEGLHRLEACRSLGEETIVCVVAQARVR